jgi:hypothetical protein
MKPNYLLTVFAVFVIFSFSSAQVGIGTVTPEASSMLDIQSTTKGLLAPRMTTAQRNAIASPAESLLVFDTDVDAFFFYSTTTSSWTKLNNAVADKRNNYKLVKSAADLAPELTAGGGSKYLLNANTLYEINGTINLTAPIDLNNAYVSGLDANEDILTRASGPIFQGTTGGSIRNVTLTGGGSAFAITGGSSLLVQNTIVANFPSVGSIANVGLYFGNIVQFLGNSSGITYTSIDNLLLNNQAWLASNGGTFETFTGSFGLIEKVSGFSTVDGSDIAIDVSSNPNVGKGVLLGTVFNGSTSNTTGYVNEYTAANTYTGYNFSNSWTVNAPGIPRESDDVATGNLYYNSSSVVNVTNTSAFKLPVNTDGIRLFRTAEGTGVNSENRLVYKGEGRRALNVFASISFTATSGTRFAFSIYKNGTMVTGTEVIIDVLQTNQRQSVPVIGTVSVNKDEYIEIWVQKLSTGSEQLLVTSYNLLVN